jgi:aspartate ammonia-lyase
MTGFGELQLPAVQPGSSIMPGKVNPSIPEAVNQTFFAVLGYDQTAAYALQAGQLELNVMMPVMAHSLLEASTIATRALHTLRVKCVEGLEPNLKRLQHYFESTPQIATRLSPRLGYEKTAELVKRSLVTGQTVLALVRQEKLISEAELDQLLNLKSLTGI